MNTMVGGLLELSKIDELEKHGEYSDFDLSSALLKTVLPFESAAYEQEKKLETDIPENITLYGREPDVKKAASILMDNAIKHSGKSAVIKASLKKAAGRCVFSVFNTGGGIREDEKDKLFERFYRGGVSRAATQGAGLGLSIINSLAEINKWKLSVSTKPEGTVTVSVTF
jgi:signal transduction histidine kinase